MASNWTCARCSAQNDEGAVSCRSCGMIRGGVVTQPNVLTPPVPMSGVPAPGGYPGAPVPTAGPSRRRSLVAGIIGNLGIRLVLLLVFIVIGGIAAYISNAGRDSSGTITKAGDMKPADLQVGDCYDLPGGSGSADPSAAIENTHAVPCSDPHHFEVFYRGDMPGSTYPTQAERHDWASTYCVPAFESYVGSTVDTTALTFFLFYPDDPGWAQGDRGAQCALADPNDAVLTGSMKGSKR